MKKSTKLIIALAAAIAVIAIIMLLAISSASSEENFRLVKNEKEYEEIFEKMGSGYRGGFSFSEKLKYILTLPMSLEHGRYYAGMYDSTMTTEGVVMENGEFLTSRNEMIGGPKTEAAGLDDVVSSEKQDQYSTTNIQVENVDEADRIKTDGKYIYTINNEVVNVVDATNPENLVYVKEIKMQNDAYPEDIFLDENKLVVIGQTNAASRNKADTLIEVYDLKDDYKLLKSYAMENKYNTSRMIDGRVIVMTTGYIDSGAKPIYKIDNEVMELSYSSMFYNEKYRSYGITFISTFNVNDLDNFNVYGCTMNTEAAYVSSDNIYIVNSYYGQRNNDELNISKIFGLKGIFGINDCYHYDYGYGKNTKILKLKLEDNNEIKVAATTKIDGGTINQFSFDEKDGHLRIALDETGEDADESSVVILDKKLKEIGKITGIAEGESIYASRFIGDRLYLVTYRNMDPLFVIDLSDEKNPKILGELKIPGYSTYLHPYDDNHIIGIGVQTEAHVNYDEFGRVISESATTLGLKMALFDVTDVTNPKELSNVVIGDADTTSNVIKNHKALLFSKERGIIAIPISISEEADIDEIYDEDNIEALAEVYFGNRWVRRNGFAVYNISLDDGISLRGNIYHRSAQQRWYSYASVPVRGIYIKDNLFTVSNDYIKVNDIATLNEITTFNLK